MHEKVKTAEYKTLQALSEAYNHPKWLIWVTKDYEILGKKEGKLAELEPRFSEIVDAVKRLEKEFAIDLYVEYQGERIYVTFIGSNFIAESKSFDEFIEKVKEKILMGRYSDILDTQRDKLLKTLEMQFMYRDVCG